MISSLLLLSAAVFANPVIISEVKAVRETGHLRVEVVGDGGIDPDGARTVIEEGRLFIYLGGTRVRADNRAWNLEDGAGEIRAHRHRTETELVVPLAGNGCTGPVELAGSDTGITALVGCEGAVSPAKLATKVATKTATNTAPKLVASTETKPDTKPASAGVAKTRVVARTDDEKLKALVGLDPLPPALPARAADADRAHGDGVSASGKPASASTADDDAAPSVAAGPRRATASASLPVPVLPAEAAPAPEAAPAREAAQRLPSPLVVPLGGSERSPAPAAESASAPVANVPSLPSPVVLAPAAPAIGPSNSSGGGARLGSVVVPALLLAALAVAAYIFARRRRVLLPRHIQIIETTSLGPKRSLIVARVGEQTLILGASEAGITLLKDATPPGATDGVEEPRRATGPLAAAMSMPAPSPARGGIMAGWIGADEQAALDSINELNQPIEEALADIPEPDQGRSNAGRGAFRAIEGGLGGQFVRRGEEPDGRGGGTDRFEDVLEDSVEDQELRQKLAAGMSARVR